MKKNNNILTNAVRAQLQIKSMERTDQKGQPNENYQMQSFQGRTRKTKTSVD